MRVLLTLLLLAAPAAAQVFPAEVTTTIDPPHADVTRGSTHVFALNVTNEGPLPGSATVDFGATPSGWSLRAEPAEFNLPGGATRRVNVTLDLAADAATGAHDLAVTTTLRIVVGEQELGSDQHTSEIGATLTLSPYDRLNDELGGLLPLVLAAAGLLLLTTVAVLVLRRRPVAVLVDREVASAPPGGTATFRLVVANRNRHRDQTRLALDGLPNGWSASFTRTQFDLRPRRQAPVELQVAVPSDAHEDAHLTVLAVGGRGGERRQALRVRVAQEAARYVDYQGEARPVTDIDGIGTTYATRLAEAGIATTTRLCYEDTAGLARLVGVPERTVRLWQTQARLMKADISPADAHDLARAGIDLESLKRETAATVTFQVKAHLEKSGRDGGAITEGRVKTWQKKARALRRVQQAVPPS